MEQSTKITLPSDLVKEIDKLAGNSKSRAKFIQKLLGIYTSQNPVKRNTSIDFKILNENADSLNREAMDVLDYHG